MRCTNRSTTSPAKSWLAAVAAALLTAPTLPAAADCLPVAGDRIMLTDLAPALPAAALDDATRSVGFAPRPGVRRTLLFREWAGTRPRLAGEPFELCVIGESRPLTPRAVRAALEQAFSGLAAQPDIDIDELPRGSVPAGAIHFPPANLRAARPNPRSGLVQLNGYILHGSDPARPLRFPIWVRARIEADLTQMELSCALEMGDELTAACLRTATVRGYPFVSASATAGPTAGPAAFLGRTARRRLAAGTPVQEPLFHPRQDVKPRQEVSLLVRCGQAALRLKATSQSGGAVGETVTIRVEGSRHALRARVTAPGAVELLVPAAASHPQPEAAPVLAKEGTNETPLD
ncbi:MAG: flagella basal body P-ring formation protein FlgA [Bryobacterales bacterium]|nr:flagella basal body P-ring formation protein FlgA [Bryobacterales bacterium]